MSIKEIFSVKRKTWKSLMQMRQGSVMCPECKTKHTQEELRGNWNICPSCKKYLPMTPQERIEQIADPGSFKELFAKIAARDPLNFPGYREKLERYQSYTGTEDAFTAGTIKIDGRKTAIGIMDGRFLMGSMGTAVGEKVTALTEYAGKRKLPLIIFCASGGARMQEGLFSLMQMAKTAAAIEKFKREGGFFLSILTNPTTGGVSASFANLGDVILAEPDALICFAGPRVIEQTIGQTLPEGFQHAEFLLEHGMIDRIAERAEQRKLISSLLRLHG